jgi:hypothetical protein
VKPWVKVFLVTITLAVPAMMFGRVIWPPAEGGPAPTAGQIPFFIFLAAAEAVAFGLGVSFLAFGFGPIRRAAGGSTLWAWLMYVSIGWLLVSWWPHDNLHIHNGENLQGLLYIEFGFHLTLMAAGVVLAYAFLAMLRQGASVTPRVQ